MRQHTIIPGVLSLISLYWIIMAVTAYGLWDEGPRGGFMPLLAGLITLVFSIMAVRRPAGKTLPWHRTIFIPGVVVISMMIVSYALGMLPAIFLMLVGWLRGLERYTWKFSLVFSACVIAIVWAIFKLWLNVPFPSGMLGLF